MSAENSFFISRVINNAKNRLLLPQDNAKNKLLHQRGLKTHLRKEVECCLDYFDKISKSPNDFGKNTHIGLLQINGLTIGRLVDQSGYYVEIEEYHYHNRGEAEDKSFAYKIDDERFTYKDRITIQGMRVTMQRTTSTQTLTYSNIPREKVETIIDMIQHATVPYRNSIEPRIEKRARIEEFVARATGQLLAKPGEETSRESER